MPRQGKLFVFEGPDGAGKSTVANTFKEYLTSQGVDCSLFAFPGKAPGSLGFLIYELHHDLPKFGLTDINPTSLQLLHIAAHIDQIENQILPLLRDGKTVILDRYWWSTWVYGLTNGVNKRSLELMIGLELHHWQSFLPTLLFLIDRNTSLREDMAVEFWNKLKANYYDLFAVEKHKYPIQLINNDGSVASTVNAVVHWWAASNQDKQKDSVNTEPLLEQLSLDLKEKKTLNSLPSEAYFYTALSPIKPTEVFDTYWYFAAERQEIFFRKFEGRSSPWTQDPILLRHKFTNAYRASDRVSQYLIGNVIYTGDQSPEELFFRILLFKVFNKISTWELLESQLGSITYSEYTFEKYDHILTEALNSGLRIFSAAYIMPSGSSTFGSSKKHRNYLKLLELLINDEVPKRITEMRSMRSAFELLRSYPLMGDFLAYQYVTDINYSTLTDFPESEFVIPGPGARDGIQKCFRDLGGLNEMDIIKMMTERQEKEFSRLGLEFKSLWGRPLQYIDCQNLFCEVDKYARVAHPSISGKSNRKRIKQIYTAKKEPIKYWYPPKWGINQLIGGEVQNDPSIRGRNRERGMG